MGLTAAILSLLAAAASCLPGNDPGRAASPVQRGPVLILGDSLTVGARDIGGLEQLLEQEGWRPEIVAEASTTVAWAIDRVERLFMVPETVVVAMGTNPGPGLGTFPDEAGSLLDILRKAGARKVLWLPPAHADGERYAERVDALLAMESAFMDVLDWPTVASANPHWFGSDGVHLTAEGYRMMAGFIRHALSS